MSLVSFFFNGKSSSDFPWLVVNKINVSILPPQEHELIEMAGRAGALHAGKRVDVRKESIAITVYGDNQEDLAAKKRILAAWLDVETPQTFYYSYEPDKEYQAVLDGETNLNKIVTDGETTLVFIMPDPYAYGPVVEVPFNPADTEPVNVQNNGTKPAFPRFEMEFTQDVPEFLIASEEEAMYFGRPAPIDTITPVPKRTLKFTDDGTSITGYTAGVGVDGGDIAGSFESTGSYIRPADYGTGTGWHGPAGVKMIPGAAELQDFTLEAHVGFRSVYNYQISRLEIYLLDINAARIGKIAMRDASAGLNSPVLEARVGPQSGGYYFVNTEVFRGAYTNFFGKLRIQRIGQWWYYDIGKRDENGNYWGRWSAKYFDKDNAYQAKLGGIQIHIGVIGTYQPYSTVYIDDINIWEENTVNPDTQVPYVFRTGDKLEVDCARGTIFRNGEPYYQGYDPAASNFIKLKPGANGISVSPAVIQNGKITFQERWA